MVKAVYSILKDELIQHGIIGKPLEKDTVSHIERIVDSIYCSFKYRSGLNMGDWEISKIFETYENIRKNKGNIKTSMQIKIESLEDYYNYIENNLADLSFFEGNRYEMKIQLLNIINNYESEYTRDNDEIYSENDNIGETEMFVTRLNIEFDSVETAEQAVGNIFIFLDGSCNLKIGRVIELVDLESSEYLVLCAHKLNVAEEYYDLKYFAFPTTTGGITLAKKYIEKSYKETCEDIAYRNGEIKHEETQFKLEKDLKEVKEEIISMCKKSQELSNEEEDNYIFELAGLFSRYCDIQEESIRKMSFTMVELNNELEKAEDNYDKLIAALDKEYIQCVENRLNGNTGVM